MKILCLLLLLPASLPTQAAPGNGPRPPLAASVSAPPTVAAVRHARVDPRPRYAGATPRRAPAGYSPRPAQVGLLPCNSPYLVALTGAGLLALLHWLLFLGCRPQRTQLCLSLYAAALAATAGLAQVQAPSMSRAVQLAFEGAVAVDAVLLLALLYAVCQRRPPWRWLMALLLLGLTTVGLEPPGRPWQSLLLAVLLPWLNTLWVLGGALRQRRPGIGLVAGGVAAAGLGLGLSFADALREWPPHPLPQLLTVQLGLLALPFYLSVRLGRDLATAHRHLLAQLRPARQAATQLPLQPAPYAPLEALAPANSEASTFQHPVPAPRRAEPTQPPPAAAPPPAPPPAPKLPGNAASASAPAAAPVPEPAADAPSVLVIEDNYDMREYLRSLLAPAGYHLLEAANGEAGLALAYAQLPDLVLSDAMMPHLDGFGVCRALKLDHRTSHIPLVLLTARADLPSRLHGLDFGADAYLTKPFRREELLAQLRNLILNRQQLQTAYHRSLTEPTPPRPPTLDDTFLTRVRQVIEAALDDETLGVETLSRELALSRTQLHRKLKALTGQAPGDFIRLVRLTRAHELLAAGGSTVAEVAYQVGYGNPANFSTSFSRHFGYAPSEARRRLAARTGHPTP